MCGEHGKLDEIANDFAATYPNEKIGEWFQCASDVQAWIENCKPNIDLADAYVQFVEKHCHHSKGEWAGQTLILMPFQRVQFRSIFGWKRGQIRRFTRASIWEPKKNGKSTKSSAIACVLLEGDGEPGAEIFCAATDRQQAQIVFGECERMVKQSPELAKKLRCYRTSKTIVNDASFSKIQAISADSYSNEGWNAHAIIVDELHAHRDRRLFDTLRFSGAARRQPLFLTISTAGEESESLGYEEYLYAKAILDGSIIDTSCFVSVYEALPEEDWTSEAVWQKANPAWGTTIKAEEMRAAFKEATTSGAKENAFRRYRLNQWTKQSVRWINMEAWDRCGEVYDEESLVGRPCYGGIDLATKRDSTALALVFPPTETDAKWRSLVRFFLPRYEVTADGSTRDNVRDRELRDRAAYYAWSKAGWLTLTDSVTTDYAFVREQIMSDQRKFQVLEWAFDPWNASHVVNELINDHGMDNLIEMRQGFASMSAPSKEFDKLVAENLWRHNRNAMLRKQVDSVSISMDPAGNIKPDKKKASYRIDGVVAIVNGLARAILAGDQNSWFQANRLLVLG